MKANISILVIFILIFSTSFSSELLRRYPELRKAREAYKKELFLTISKEQQQKVLSVEIEDDKMYEEQKKFWLEGLSKEEIKAWEDNERLETMEAIKFYKAKTEELKKKRLSKQ